MHLSGDDGVVDMLAVIVEGRIADQAHGPRLRVDLDLRQMGAVREGHPLPRPVVIGVERALIRKIEQADRPVGAGDAERAGLVFDIRFRRLQPVRRQGSALLDDDPARAENRRAGHVGRARAAVAASHGDLVRVALDEADAAARQVEAAGHDFREGGLVPLADMLRAGDEVHTAVAVEAQFDILLRVAAGRLDVAGEAEPAKQARRLAPAPALREAPGASLGKRKALAEGAAVHGEAERIRHRQAGHEISTPELLPANAGFRRRLVDQAFENVHHFGESGAARHALGRRIGQHGADMQRDCRNGIDRAGEMDELPGLDAARDIAEPGARIRFARYPERKKAPFAVEREFGFSALAPALVVGQEGFGARGRPAHGTAQPPGRPEQQRIFRIVEILDAEAAAHILRDEAHPPGLDAQARRHMVAVDVQVLAGKPQRIAAFLRVIEAGRAPRLHRVDDHAVVQKRDPDPVGGAGECCFHGLAVARPPVEAGLFRLRVQRLIDDPHPVRRVLGLVRRGPGDEGDRLARITGGIARQ